MQINKSIDRQEICKLIDAGCFKVMESINKILIFLDCFEKYKKQKDE